MIGIILAAGDGVRYKNSISEDRCKVLSTINNKALLKLALDNFKALDIKKVFIVVGNYAEAIKNEVGYSYKDMTVTYVNQTQRKGLINALIQPFDVISADDVILQLADEILINFRAKDVAENLAEKESDFLCGITYETNPDKIKNNYSVSVDENFFLEECIEKPEKVINNIKGTGFCVFNKQCIQLLYDNYDKENNKIYDLCDYMNFLVSSGKKGRCVCIADKEFNINEYKDLQEAIDYCSANDSTALTIDM